MESLYPDVCLIGRWPKWATRLAHPDLAPTNQQASPLSNSLLLLVLFTAPQLNKRLVPQPQPLGYPKEEFTELRS
jgi:hypothetical protein